MITFRARFGIELVLGLISLVNMKCEYACTPVCGDRLRSTVDR